MFIGEELRQNSNLNADGHSRLGANGIGHAVPAKARCYVTVGKSTCVSLYGMWECPPLPSHPVKIDSLRPFLRPFLDKSHNHLQNAGRDGSRGKLLRTRCSEITFETDIGQTTLMSSLIPRPHPAFHCLQYLTLSFSFTHGESLGMRLSDESIFATLSTSTLSLQRLVVNVTYDS